MITGTWTAAEIFMEDIWMGAVDINPEAALSREVKPGRLRFDKDTKCLELIIPWEDFKQAGFTLGRKFSELLKDKYKFDTFDSVSHAFGAAFSRQFESFDTDKDRGLYHLAKTRNVILHSGAKVDEPFLKSMVDIDPTRVLPKFSGLQLSDTVPIDGEMVSRIVGDSIVTMKRLIKDVDAIL